MRSAVVLCRVVIECSREVAEIRFHMDNGMKGLVTRFSKVARKHTWTWLWT